MPRRIFETTIISGYKGAFDCLIKPDLHRYYRDFGDHIFLDPDSQEISYYCRRSTLSNSHLLFSMSNLSKTNYPIFTFDHLRSIGITYQQLYEWYAPIDLIEEYIAGKQTGLFVNCSNTMWFGAKCEYTFDSDKKLAFILTDQSHAKHNSVPVDLSVYTNGPCYEMVNTGCESIICLDWREICDGKN